MNENETIVFGVPVPSDNKVFLTFVVIHILLGITCTISGIMAMLSRKAKGTHPNAGKVYYWAMTILFATVIITSIMRWPHNIHLLIVGGLAYTFTFIGRQIAKAKRPNWTRPHSLCMGASFVLLMTGFYVDNGKNLPFWNQFPQWFFWIFPSAIGIPIIIYVFFKHSLNKKHQ